MLHWGMISGGWKDPFHVWSSGTKEEKDKAKKEIGEWKARCKEKEEKTELAMEDS